MGRPNRKAIDKPAVLHIVGARPNFMKAAPVIKALSDLGVPQNLVHTGQHYDPELSEVFFRELHLPQPDWNLAVGSGTHAKQTAAMMVGLEDLLMNVRPQLAIVYGDVNSVVAGALAAAKLGVPIAHVEAGLRCFDDRMPEEINRKVADLLSEILFATVTEAIENLRQMGVPESRIHFVGNPMIDSLLAILPNCDSSRIREKLGIGSHYVVVTLHRSANVDDASRVRALAHMVKEVARVAQVVFPVHPRGRDAFRRAGVTDSPNIKTTAPLGYLDFVSLMRDASAVVTDSGGVQEETTVLGVPCLTVRPSTERPSTIRVGTNRLAEPEEVPELIERLIVGRLPGPASIPPLWDGRAGRRIARIVREWIDRTGTQSTVPPSNGRA